MMLGPTARSSTRPTSPSALQKALVAFASCPGVTDCFSQSSPPSRNPDMKIGKFSTSHSCRSPR